MIELFVDYRFRNVICSFLSDGERKILEEVSDIAKKLLSSEEYTSTGECILKGELSLSNVNSQILFYPNQDIGYVMVNAYNPESRMLQANWNSEIINAIVQRKVNELALIECQNNNDLDFNFVVNQIWNDKSNKLREHFGFYLPTSGPNLGNWSITNLRINTTYFPQQVPLYLFMNSNGSFKKTGESILVDRMGTKIKLILVDSNIDERLQNRVKRCREEDQIFNDKKYKITIDSANQLQDITWKPLDTDTITSFTRADGPGSHKYKK